MKRAFHIIGLISLIGLIGPISVFASTTDGTIDSTSKYAWGSNIGWVNFGTSGGNVHVTDSALTGYVWSQNYGWINLAPAGSGVMNNGGTLSGQAWGENLGYIDFSGVTISASGQFSGHASGTLSGQINFDCSNCTVLTDWRPASARGSGSSGGGGGGGGGGAVPAGLGIVINGGNVATVTPLVTLTFNTDGSVTHMYVSNFADLHDAVQEPIASSKQWNVCSGTCAQGPHAVYVKFYSSAGGATYGPFSASIYYGIPPAGYTPPASAGPTTPTSGASLGETILDNLYGFFDGLIPDFLKPSGPLTEKVALDVIVPEYAPLSMKGRWTLLPADSIRAFAFAPLPKDIALLESKFPAIKETFKSVGVSRQADIGKLKGIALRIPGFAESTLPSSDIRSAKLGYLPNIPIVKLGAQLKQAIPSEVLFVRAGGESIDLPVSASVNERGISEQRVNAVAGTILKLVIKPEHPAKQVLGYLAFKSHGQSLLRQGFGGQGRELGIMDLPTEDSGAQEAQPSMFASMLASIGSAMEGAVTPKVEERFVVREFSYTDTDGDGIYTANVQAPVVSGSYDIHTIIDYVDPRYANSDIKLTTVIDPEGYVYESIAGKELRIPGAVVSLLWLNPATNAYELWPAEKFSQENPQVTDVRGTYAFLVPPGFYSFTITAPGYASYEGKPFEVTESGNGVHMNIELKGGGNWLDAFDWKTDLLILLALLSAYNFYVDHKRRMLAQP